MNRLLLALCLTSSLLAGCRKADLINCAPTTLPTPVSLADFTRHNGAPIQTFPMRVGLNVPPQSLTTQGGATLMLPAENWVLPDGTLAVGQAEVRVRELYSVADMVLSQQATTQYPLQNVLVSGGEFNIQVRLGSQRLRLRQGLSGSASYVTVQSLIPPGQDTTAQRVWYQPARLATADSAGWLAANAPLVQKSGSTYRAFLPLDSIGWWNIDQYWSRYSATPQVPVTVLTPANPTTDTRVYFRPVGYNGLARLYASKPAGDSWSRAVPTGTEQVAVVLQSRNGQLYYGTQPFTVQSGLTLVVLLAPVSESQAVQLIRQL